MSTRGTLAVRIDGVTKGSYNHSDSYPTWLGNRVLEYLAALKAEEGGMDKARTQARLLREVPKRKPTPAEIKRLAPYTDLGVSEGSTQDWYCLLRLAQGDLALVLESGYYYPMGVGEEEWSYVIDFDAEALEVFEYDTRIATIPFDSLPVSFKDDMLTPAT